MRSTTKLMKNWQFTGPDGKTTAVDLPHTWNNIDGQDGGNDYWRGTCIYKTQFTAPAFDKNTQQVWLQFEGVNASAKVTLNGVEVQGQLTAKRALLVAASGEHNLLLVGPPGTGKTLLASRLPGLLPELDEQEALQVAAIHSVASAQPLQAWPQRPFRQPHHSASGPALVGGGSRPRPGEITLAHQGVLFLDELPEFDRKVLEVLREPLESGEIVIARAQDKIRFPARFQLVAAMNPCPCGYLGDPSGRCRCSSDQVQRYRSKLSGPLLDRIDLHVSVAREQTALQPGAPSQGSAELAAQVAAARQRQLQRQGCSNARLDLAGVQRHCVLESGDRLWLEQACERLGLSLRAAHRLLKVARTLADLEQLDAIARVHLAEALQYRPA